MSKKFVISAKILGVDKYVSELVPAPHNKKAVGNYCLLPGEAIIYDDFDTAYAVVNAIHNLQDRDFSIHKFTPAKTVGRPALVIDKSLK